VRGRKKSAPRVRLELTTYRLTAGRAADCAIQEQDGGRRNACVYCLCCTKTVTHMPLVTVLVRTVDFFVVTTNSNPVQCPGAGVTSSGDNIHCAGGCCRHIQISGDWSSGMILA
jgi:hypothetical protein